MRELPGDESLRPFNDVPVPRRTSEEAPSPKYAPAKSVQVVRPGILNVDGRLETDLPLPKFDPSNNPMYCRDVGVATFDAFKGYLS
jgi:hypothetical protein